MRWEFGTVVLASLRTPTSHMRMCLLESQLPFWFQLPGDVHSRRQLVMTHMLASPEPEWVHGEGTGRWESFGWPTPHPAGAGDRGKLPQWQTQVPKFQSWSWKSPHSPTASSNQSAHTTYTFVGQLAPHTHQVQLKFYLASSLHGGRAWTTIGISHQHSMDTIVI